MIWKIIDLICNGDIVTQVKYSVEKDDVKTEGYWTLKNSNRKVAEQLTEKDVISWIKEESVIDGICIIEDNLQKQIDNVQVIAKKPWVKPTFTVKI